MSKSVRLLGKHFVAVAERIAEYKEEKIAKRGIDGVDDYSCCNFTDLHLFDQRILYSKVLRKHGINPDGGCFNMNPSEGYTAAERNEQRIMFLCLLAAEANYRSKK